MKAYLDTKAEAAKNTILNFPATVKAWPGKKWESTKHKMNTTDWPVTITHFIGWTIRQSVSGALYGMGAFSLLTQAVVWDALNKRDLGEGPVPMDDVYSVLANGFGVNVIFAGAGILACMVINASKLRLIRTERHEPQVFVLQPTDQEAVAMVRAIVDRQNKPKIS